MWEELYNFFGITDFIYFISSSELQDMLFPVKLVFVSFGMFFLVGVVYFMLNSSWLQFKFLEDVTEFFSWQAYGARQISKQWAKIKKRIEGGTEADYKLAILDADDFMSSVLDERGYEGKSFEESLKKASKIMNSVANDILKAHEVRNSIIYNPDFKLPVDEAKKILDTYETAINSIGVP